MHLTICSFQQCIQVFPQLWANHVYKLCVENPTLTNSESKLLNLWPIKLNIAHQLHTVACLMLGNLPMAEDKTTVLTMTEHDFSKASLSRVNSSISLLEGLLNPWQATNHSWISCIKLDLVHTLFRFSLYDLEVCWFILISSHLYPAFSWNPKLFQTPGNVIISR